MDTADCSPAPALPDQMSLTMVVPLAVPSLFQSSVPFVPSLAVKRRVPFMFVRDWGEALAEPGQISFTRDVPLAVPSLFQSSVPITPSLAAQKRVPFTFVRNWGAEPL